MRLKNQQNMIAQQRREEQKSNVGRMAGAAIGNALVTGVGGVVGGLLEFSVISDLKKIFLHFVSLK